MKVKIGIYSLFILLLIFESCGSSKRVIYFQSEKSIKGQIVNLPSYRNEKTVRFGPDDVLSITVNVPGEPNIAADYNLPMLPVATPENATEDYVNQSAGIQTFLIKKDGTIDYPVIGNIKVSGYTQGELENLLKEKLMQNNLKVTPIVTVRLRNFDIFINGEINRPGRIRVDRDNINIFQALSLAGDMTIYGRRDDILLIRQTPDGYDRISLDISKEDIISSPYYFLQQNDELYIKPNNARAQVADISPSLNTVLGIGSFLMSLTTFILLLAKK